MYAIWPYRTEIPTSTLIPIRAASLDEPARLDDLRREIQALTELAVRLQPGRSAMLEFH